MPALGLTDEFNLMVLRAECCCGANAAAVQRTSAALIDCLILQAYASNLAAEGHQQTSTRLATGEPVIIACVDILALINRTRGPRRDRLNPFETGQEKIEQAKRR